MDTNTSIADIIEEVKDTMKELTERLEWVIGILKEIEDGEVETI